MLELSLFSGAGGGLLGSHLLGWRPIGYVEIDDYCQRVLAARIQDGYLPEAPIFGDIRAFLREGYAERYRGVAEVITAGFPCQPFSVAGKQQGADDDRNLWPETRDTLHIVRPRYCLLENVPGLLAGSHGYFGTILGELAELGYDARWGVLGADDAGAPHRRKRLWVVAAHPERLQLRNESGRCSRTDGEGTPELGDDGAQGDVADPRCDPDEGTRPNGHDAGCVEGWWATEPPLGRVAHGVANRVGQLRALGNGQVPAVVRLAWMLLSR
jgi:DNA (cytosine-5)-methyltransferase 1